MNDKCVEMRRKLKDEINELKTSAMGVKKPDTISIMGLLTRKGIKQDLAAEITEELTECGTERRPMIQVRKKGKKWHAYKLRPINGDLLVMTAPSREDMSERLHKLKADPEKRKELGIAVNEKVEFI
jgi:hypothetical protein